MLRFPIFLAPLLLALSSGAHAQLRHPGDPASNSGALPNDIPLELLPTPDVPALLAEDQANDHWPFRYGATIATELSANDRGRWDALEATGELVWRLEIASPGALTLGVTFSRFDLPTGGRLFLYDPQKREILGAYTEANEKPNGEFAVQPVPGDRIVVEYVHPRGADLPDLSIGEVIHDYRNILAHLGEAQFSGGCLVDINCPVGADYQDAKRGVVWLIGGGGGCSGFLLNNTGEDAMPFLMTAEHCGDMTNAVVIFDYERTGCDTGSSSQSKSLSGATFLKASNPFDGQLYLLTQSPPASYEPFYCGWTLDESVEAPGVGISHPAGNPKKIQKDNQAPTHSSSRWSVSFDVGIIQGGSSGSPLFDHRKRVIGICSAGISSCASNLALYGRFDRFYETRDLDVFLDPLNWGLSGIDGYDPFSAYLIPFNGTGTNDEIFSGLALPVLGTTWSTQIDTSSIPQAVATAVFGYSAPFEGLFLSFGELLFDPTSTPLVSSTSSVAGGLSQHDFALPNSVSLVGNVGYLQAFVVGGGSLTATNGLKAVLHL